MDRARGIAKDGDMPWHLPGDLAFFAKLTTGAGGNTVVMGRKTWETIPERYRPLPRRRNIVITRQDGYAAEGAEVASSLDAALELARDGSESRLFVIGGAQIYALALQHPDCAEVYITEIDRDFDCEVFFPQLPDFDRTETLGEGAQDGLPYRFTRWRRRAD
jgi:dihydrofolate reductase